MKDVLRNMVELAVLAPSGHNTQPWQFRIDHHSIEIHPDFSRALPVVDADNHALYISLGCAAENIAIAATAQQLTCELSLHNDADHPPYIKMKFLNSPGIRKDVLYESIRERQVTRNKYSHIPIDERHLQQLRSVQTYNGVSVRYFLNKEEIRILEPFILEGSDLQFKERKFVDELLHWIRFSQKDATRKMDGIRSASMGLPPVPTAVGKFFMTKFVNAKSESKRWKELIERSAGFVMFIADKNEPEFWVNLGRTFERFALTATKIGVSHAHVNMPCEEVSVRSKMANALGLNGKHPLLLLRVGYSPKMPPSYRRQVSEVMMN